MNKILISLFSILMLLSCSKSKNNDEKQAWDYLYNNEADKAYILFKELIKENSSEKNHLGLAYTQAALDKDNYYSTLNKGFKNYIISYGYLVGSYARYYKSKDTIEFDINEFKALNNDGRFKTKKGSQIIEGEYKDLKPYGRWKFYNLSGELIKEIDGITIFQ